MHTTFKRSRKHTCPVCGKTHRYHCSISDDETLAICKHTPSDKQAKDGRYIHRLNDDAFISSKPRTANVPRETKDELTRADADHTHAVYTAMLERLTLAPAHADNFLDVRGLSDSTIAANLYASVPDAESGQLLVASLAHDFDLRGVPGFYRQDGWRLNTKHAGFYVPCRDARGRIVGCQIRRDSNDQLKYVWLSSKGLPEGVTSGTPVHFAKPDLSKRTRRAIITEGILKADICAEMLDCCVIGFAGASSFPNDVGAQLRESLPRLAEVAIAYDADLHTKPEVKAALLRVRDALRRAGVRVRAWTWDVSEGKGFDDYLLARRAAERRAA